MDVAWYIVLSALIFCVGLAGVLTRRNPLVVLLSLELLLNAGNYLKGYLGNRISQVNPMIDGGADGVSATPSFTVEDVIPYYLYIETPLNAPCDAS